MSKEETMFKFTQVVPGLVLMAVACCAYSGEEDIRKSLAENLPQAKVGAITKLPYAGLYQVVVNGTNIIYTDEKGEVGFLGTMLDLKSKTNLTQQEKDKIVAVDFFKLPFEDAIVRVRGNGRRKLAVFADPECPYCQGLEKELESVSDVTIYTFLLPLNEIHPGALRKAQLIWCAKDRAQAWDDMLLRQQEPKGSNTDCDTPIKAIAELAPKLWINGTPGIVFPSGKLLLGNQPHERIAKLLDEPTQQP
jgi:thiol:disulfide interchange protein DsbC